jgi:hypothetical protein
MVWLMGGMTQLLSVPKFETLDESDLKLSGMQFYTKHEPVQRAERFLEYFAQNQRARS